jgi:hypothetical protein
MLIEIFLELYISIWVDANCFNKKRFWLIFSDRFSFGHHLSVPPHFIIFKVFYEVSVVDLFRYFESNRDRDLIVSPASSS